MSKASWIGRAAFALAAALAFSTSASGQSYGLGDQILTVGSTEFRPYLPGQTFAFDENNYLSGGFGQYVAPVHLPDGAQITSVCMFFLDPDGGGSDAVLAVQQLLEPGQDPGPGGNYVILASSVSENSSAGIGSTCTDLVYTVHSDGNVPDRGMRHEALVANLTLWGANVGFGGLRITWHRQVSDAPASPTFGDVPADAFGFQQIEALAAAGITGGCGGGNFCPDAPITRAQMAIFFAKALGLHWPN